jgi:hypothetical protein
MTTTCSGFPHGYTTTNCGTQAVGVLEKHHNRLVNSKYEGLSRYFAVFCGFYSNGVLESNVLFLLIGFEVELASL